MGLASYTAITDSLRASRILDNPTIIQASFALDNITESYRRRTGTTRTWRFRYSFEVDGTQYEQDVGTVLTPTLQLAEQSSYKQHLGNIAHFP